MKRARIAIEFDVHDDITRGEVYSMAGDAYAQIDDAKVPVGSDGNEKRVATYNVSMEVKF